MTEEYLQTDIADLEAKIEKIKRYNQLCEDYRLFKDRKSFIKKINAIPTPEYLKTSLTLMLVIAGVLAALIYYMPFVSSALFKNWTDRAIMDIVNYLGIALALMLLFIMTIWRQAGSYIWASLKAWRGKPIVELWSKNRIIEYAVPSEVRHDVWKLSDRAAVTPDPGAIMYSKNKIPFGIAIPEFPVLLNVRELLAGRDPGIDMASIQTYAEEHEIRAYKEARNNMDVLKPWIGPILILLLIGLIFGPSASKFMDQSGQISDYQNQVVRLRIQLADHGITPYDMNEPKKPAEATENSQVIKPADTGANIKSGK